MVDKKMYRKIQRMKKEGCGKNRIRKELAMDPATVRKYYHMEPLVYTAYQKQTTERNKAFGRYQLEILELYEENGYQKLVMSGVYDYLEERYGKLPGNEQSLRNFIHYLERNGYLRYQANVRIYQKVDEMPFGKQAQLDFGEYKQRKGPKLYIVGIVLSSSRYKYVAFQDRPFVTEDVILHLLDSFDYFGGIPEELVIDQDSLMVASENHGDIIYTKKFDIFLREMGLKMYVCRKNDPQSKGRVENLIKYVKHNFLSVRNFMALQEAQEALSAWLVRRANGKICQTTKRVPSIVITEERPHLRPLKNSIFRRGSYLGREERVVSDKSFVMVGSNEYSLPTEYRDRIVEMYKAEKELYLYNKETGKEICCHKIPEGVTGKKVVIRSHFRANSTSVNALEQKVRAYIAYPAWQQFVTKNHETYSRYFRDQCMLAEKYFSQDTENIHLHRALDYCIENKTFSMKALYDTYRFYIREGERENECVVNPPILETVKPFPEFAVSARSMESYESLVTSKAGGLQ